MSSFSPPPEQPSPDQTSGMTLMSSALGPISAEQRRVVEEAQKTALSTAKAFTQLQEELAESASSRMAARIYVGSLHFELTEEHVKSAFIAFGPIKSCSIQRDAQTGKSKGFCFLEFVHPESADAALIYMNGFLLAGRPIKVGRPTASGMSGLTAASSLLPFPGVASPGLPGQPIPGLTPVMGISAVPKPSGGHRIYVGSIHWDLTEADIRAVFEPFGNIRSCQLMPNPETGKHKGFGFIEFETLEQAENAIKSMNGFALGGRQLKVNHSTASQSSSQGSAPVTQSATGANMVPVGPMGAMMGAPPGLVGFAPGIPLPGLLKGGMMPAPPGGMFPLPAMPMGMGALGAATGIESLSREENVTISGAERLAVMQKLAARSGPLPSRVIVLRNMVTPEEVDGRLENEVTEECSKYGHVERVVIYQERGPDGHTIINVKIFVLFGTIADAQMAQQALEGRFFAGRSIRAEFFDEAMFMSNRLSG